ncbi:DUF11 domain-containing protein [Streptosporangium sp. NPDC000239]|uniref:DUF11 domain-containing protein n=1 Tax=Streptosporangium sp. NPDC000239 TaxID=3154248 RepID=UPI00332771AF
MRAGHEVVFAMTIRNVGPAVAREVVVRDPLDDRLTFLSVSPDSCGYRDRVLTCRLGRLGPEEAVTVEWRGLVSPDTPDGYRLRNVAKVSGVTPESRLDNNLGRAEITVTNRPPHVRRPRHVKRPPHVRRPPLFEKPPLVAGPAPVPREELPFTGFPAWLLGLAGLLVVAGSAVRWTARRTG